MTHHDLVILFPIWACMALVTLVLTQASFRTGYSIPHLGLNLTRDLISHSGPQTKLVTLVIPLGLTLTWQIWSPLGLHLGLVNLVLSWSAHGSGDCSPPGPHMDLVNPVATCTSPGPSDSFPTWHQWDIVTLFPTRASPGHDNFAPHFGLNWS